jgi:hypothetical protein
MLELLGLEGQICHKSNMCFPSDVPSFVFQKKYTPCMYIWSIWIMDFPYSHLAWTAFHLSILNWAHYFKVTGSVDGHAKANR